VANEVEHEDEGTIVPPGGRLAALAAGPILAVLAWAFAPAGLAPEARATLGLATLMACWWLTGAVHLAVTALLPVLLLPLLGIRTFAAASAPYSDSLIFLFAGGVTLARGLETYGLSERFAAALLRLAGHGAKAIVGALMLATALLSGFVSNTATAAMMLPIGIALVTAAERAGDAAGPARDRRNFGTATVLGIAYAASVGGVLTIIGSPPNLIAADYLSSLGQPVSFAGWMRFGLPTMVLLLPATWYLLVRWLVPVGSLRVETPPRRTGPAPVGARSVGAIFLLTVAAWMTRPLWPAWGPLPGVTDGAIALAGALALLVVPVSWHPYRPLLAWRDLRTMPWGVLILFGGGLSLAGAIQSTGLAVWIGQSLGFATALPELGLILSVTLAGTFASELASNTALAATVVPILGAVAEANGRDPAILVVPMALGASLAFMMPVGTPPNAMAYATGRITVRQMASAGVVLNLVAAAVITAVVAIAC